MIKQQVLFMYQSQDSIPHSVQAWFGIQHIVVYECSSGHTFQEPAEQPRHPFTPRIQDLRQSACRTPDGSPLLSDVLSHLVPYRLTNMLPIHLQSSITCHNKECQDLSKVISVTTHWPQILQITLRPEGPDLQLEETLHIGSAVEYKLVGCIFFNRGGSHFFSHLFVGGQLYRYDDLVKGGKLQELTGGVFDYDPTFEINALFYNRVSAEGVSVLAGLYPSYSYLVQATNRDTAAIHLDFEDPASRSNPVYIEIEDHDDPLPTPYFPPLPPIPDNISLDDNDSSHFKCAGCLLLHDLATDQSEAIQCALCQVWHHIGCLLKTYGLPEGYSKLKVVWACPHCGDGSSWDEHLYVLHFPV